MKWAAPMKSLRPAFAEFKGCLDGLRIAGTSTKRMRRLGMALDHIRRQRRRRRDWREARRIDQPEAERRLDDWLASSGEAHRSALFPDARGNLLITAHHGDFLTGIAMLGRLHAEAGRKLFVLLSDTFDVADAQYGRLARRLNVEFIRADLRQALAVLQAGDGLVVLVDAAAPLPTMRFVPFMGGMIAMLPIAPRLAAATGARVLPFLCAAPGGVPSLEFDPAILWPSTGSRGGDAYLGCAMIASWLERRIAADPAGWHHWDRFNRQFSPDVERPELYGEFKRLIADRAAAVAA